MKKFQALLIAVAFMGSVAAQAQHDHAADAAAGTAAPATTESTQTTQQSTTTTETKKSPKAAAAEKKCAKMKDEAKKAECMSKAAAM